MISDGRAFVWMFPEGRDEPVVAGVMFPSSTAKGMSFQYARSYVEGGGVALGPDLPVERGVAYPPVPGLDMPFTIRDAMPDNWGRQVINRQVGVDLEDVLPDLRYMLESGSDRVGALDFQASATDYVPRSGGGRLKTVAEAAVAIDDDAPAGPDLDAAIRNTLTAAGGSQPKAFVRLEGRSWLAKFTTNYDRVSPLIKAERAAIYIADKAGLDVPDARLVDVGGRGLTLLIERFDRIGDERRQVLSGNTVTEYAAPDGASYPLLVERLSGLSVRPAEVGPELFRRLAFRMAMRVDDDHLRNVAVFWNGTNAEFTPAFDLSPDLNATPGGLTDIGDGSREFSLEALVRCHSFYRVSRADALSIARHMIAAVREHRADAAEVAQMTAGETRLLMQRTATTEIIGAVESRHVAAPGLPSAGHIRRGDLDQGRPSTGGDRGGLASSEDSPPEGGLHGE